MESFSSEYDYSDYLDWIEQGNGDPVPAPLALYVQDSRPDHQAEPATNAPPVSERVDCVLQELRLQGQLIDSDRPLQQFICSGSIAVEWSDDQLYQLVSCIQESFFIHRGSLANWSVCLGTLEPGSERLRLLRVLGFNHLRVACREDAGTHSVPEQMSAVIQEAHRLGMERISMDLVQDTGAEGEPSVPLEQFLTAGSPERIRLKGIRGERYQGAVQLLSSMGYENIGLDWFVREGDPWRQLRAERQLHWSMLGFVGAPAPDVIGVGPGAISSVCEFYGLHEDHWAGYRAAIQQGRIPVARGIELEPDDVLRREIMDMILAASRIPVRMVEEKWGICFGKFFAQEVAQLRESETCGVIDWSGEDIVIRTRQRSELVDLCRIFHRRGRLNQLHPELICV